MLTITVGLPGSGKSTLAIIEILRGLPATLHDDVLGRAEADPNRPGLHRFTSAVAAGDIVHANDCILCLESQQVALDRIIDPHRPAGYPVRWRYFANAPDACRNNVERRHRAEVARRPERGDLAEARRLTSLELIARLAPLYHIPRGADRIPVVDYTR